MFVYGSLKAGFPNHGLLQGAQRVPGRFRTARPYPLLLAAGRLPCLLDEPGHGLPVQGEVYQVDAPTLQALDRLERLGEPGGYRRVQVPVLPLADTSDDAGGRPPGDAASGPVHRMCQAYVQDRAVLQGPGDVGPLEVYTLEHARHLSW